jgi:hypothetical protein
MEHLETVLEALNSATYYVKYDHEFGQNKVNFKMREYYIKDIKAEENATSINKDFTVTVCTESTTYTVTISPNKPTDERTKGYFGFSMYESRRTFTGHLIDDKFTTYKGKWCKIDSYIARINGPEGYNYEEEVLTNTDDKVIMNTDFTPDMPIKLANITNEGLKYVCASHVDYACADFSIIGYQLYKFIVPGRVAITGEDLFQYSRECEQLTMLWDPINLETLMINNKDQQVEMERIHKYTVNKVDGLYNGHKIVTDISKFSESGEPTVFCVNGVFFAQNDVSGYVRKLSTIEE